MKNDRAFKGYELENKSYDELQKMISNNEENENKENATNCNTEKVSSNLLSFIINIIIVGITAIGAIYFMLFEEIFFSSNKPKKKTKRKYYYSWRKGWF